MERTSNPYRVLGVTPSMTFDDAKEVYRKLCKEYHPDNMGSSEKFVEVNRAWKELVSIGDSAFGNKTKRWTHVSLFRFKQV